MTVQFASPQTMAQLLDALHGTGRVPTAILESRLFLNARQEAAAGDAGLLARRLVEQLLTEATVQQPEAAQVLRRRYVHNEKRAVVALALDVSEATVDRRQRAGMAHLTELFNQHERAARAAHHAQILGQLEIPTELPLVGVERVREEVRRRLTGAEPPWLLVIDGIGGIGKTALTAAVMQAAVQNDDFTGYGWVSAQPAMLLPHGAIDQMHDGAVTAAHLLRTLATQLLPNTPLSPQLSVQGLVDLLQEPLAQAPHLVVVDNLETVADGQALLDALHQLANPSRFLLTSRQQMATRQPILRWPMRELSEADSILLLRQEGALSGLAVMPAYSDDDLRAAVALVGGNPLALRLVAGLLHNLALDVVLAQLAHAQGASAENLYTYIYRCAWDQLDALARDVFLYMPLVAGRREALDFLIDATGLDSAELTVGLNRLAQLNLINVHPDPAGYRYSIHSLTNAFLLKQALAWE